MKLITIAIASILILASASSQAETVRHRTTVYAFKVSHVCPATHKKGNFPCPGYVVDHVIPLCKNGPDTVANMQWQTIAEGKAKDKWECKKTVFKVVK